MNESIMPLVEENRKLHDEVRALKAALVEQNVRVDEMVSNLHKSAVHYLDVEIPHAMFSDPREVLPALGRDLAANMVSHIRKLAMRVESASGTVVYRFAFLKVGK